MPIFRHEGGSRDVTPPSPPPRGWRRAVDAHCEEHLGACPGVFHELLSDRVHLDLHPHPPTPYRPRWTVVTGGVSDLETAAPEAMAPYRRIELLAYLPPSWPVQSWGPRGTEEAWWPARMLKDLGRLVHDHQTWLGPGHTVALGGERHKPFVRSSLLTSVILIGPGYEAATFDRLSIDGIPCRFLWACPITEGEERLALEQGAEVLYELMDRHHLPREIDPHRACMVTGRAPVR